MTEAEKKFWSRFRQEGACLLWTGCVNKNTGYGSAFFDGKTRLVHRLAWKLRHGGIADGLWVLHSHACKNKHCAADNHLRLGTSKENEVDRSIDGYRLNVSLPGERNGLAKLTKAKVAIVRDPATVPRTFKELAALWGVSFSLLYKIRRREKNRWPT